MTTTAPSITNEYTCVRLPAALPSAVRDPLLLTGIPCVSPAPRLEAPSARSSVFASISSRRRFANERAVSTLSVYPTIISPSAGSASSPMSVTATSGTETSGRPKGTLPTTATWSVRPSTATRADAPSTTISGPGALGNQCWIASRRASVPRESVVVATSRVSMLATNDASRSDTEPRSTSTPVSVPSCPTIIVSATPVR